MKLDPRAQDLYDQLCELPTVDAHEHLHSEQMRLSRKVDIFLLFHQYLAAQYVSAGMPPEHVQALESEEVPLDQKWDYLSPYLDFVRTGSIARPPFEALKRFFDEEDLTKDNYERLTEQMRAHSTPGLFDRCLKDACNIVMVLNQNRTMWQTDLFKPILFETDFIGGNDRASFGAVAQQAGDSIPSTLSGFIPIMEKLLQQRRNEGMIGVKTIGFERVEIEPVQANLAYRHLLAGHADGDDLGALSHYLRDRMWEACGRIGLVAVVHTGVWAGNYADHATIRPTNVLPMALAHPNTRFDLFHAGTPRPADAGMVARATHNVWLNLCWSHLISPTQAEQALDLWLDYVPTNRLFAFGGDYWWNVENVYGALMQCREVVAKVLARRVSEGHFDESRALWIARRWFHDNPREAYSV
ncbi:MAG: amidohydrolase family protein [Armatimonadota bacterium]